MNEKVKSILAYVFGWIGGLIVLFACKNERNTNIHAAQSIVISFANIIAATVLGFLHLGALIGIVSGICFVAVILGIIKVCKETEPEITVVGEIAKSMFAGKIEG